MVEIIELIHFGKIAENGFAEIDVNIHFKNENKTFNNLKAFIDTGANCSGINEKYLINKIDITNNDSSDVDSANGGYKSKQIPNVGISLAMTNGKFIPLDKIGTIKLEKLEYDLQYIKNITFVGDVKIIFKTVLKVLKRDDINTDGMDTAEDLCDYLLRTNKITEKEYKEKLKIH